jgi:hypothetical protein
MPGSVEKPQTAKYNAESSQPGTVMEGKGKHHITLLSGKIARIM